MDIRVKFNEINLKKDTCKTLVKVLISKGDKGEKGEKGDSNVLKIGTVEKGDTASASITGESPNQTLNLVLPKGDKGQKGNTGKTGKGINNIELIEGTHKAGELDTYRITYTDGTTKDIQVYNGKDGKGTGDMTKEEYDTDNDGVIDNASKVNGHTVETDVPSNAFNKASENNDGFMSKEDFIKLKTIENNAQENKIEKFKVNGIEQQINKKEVNIEVIEKKKVQELIDKSVGGITNFDTKIVTVLPQIGVKGIIYLILNSSAKEQNIYDEYLWIENKFELLGSTKLDLTNYVKVITTEEEIQENTNYEIPLKYIVGNNSLLIYYEGEKLIKDVHYIEVGNNESISNIIQFKDWGMNVPIGRTIEFNVKGVVQDES